MYLYYQKGNRRNNPVARCVNKIYLARIPLVPGAWYVSPYLKYGIVDKHRLTRKRLQSKENLEKLTEAAAGLKTLDFYIGEKDYQALRLAMRRPPIVYLRASARKVIVSMDNEVEAKKVSHM